MMGHRRRNASPASLSREEQSVTTSSSFQYNERSSPSLMAE